MNIICIMNLIYMCVFHQENYINLLKLLITSISIKANINKETTNILIITSAQFQSKIQKELESFDLPLLYYILDLHTLFEAACSRLNIFKYNNIDNYNNILYLDTDVLINSDINVLFNNEISSEKIYALEEGTIGGEYWGKEFFDFSNFNRNITAFSSGVLYFMNSLSMKKLFEDINIHIIKSNYIPVCLDQPYIVYNAISQNKYDNQTLKCYIKNNPSILSPVKIIYHFPGIPGNYSSKYDKMNEFWNKMIKN